MLQVVKATVQDIPLIRELCFKIWPQTYSHLLSQEQVDYMLDMMYSEASLQRQMEDEGCTFIVVFDNEQAVAFASYGAQPAGIWKLHKIYILLTRQGKGIGRFIINYIVSAIKPQNAKALQLQVNRENKAKDFYERLGFKIIQSADFDIGNGYFMNDYIMELSL